MRNAVCLLLLILSLASCANNAKINAIDPVTGMSPLAKAIAQGNVRKVKALIKAGADIDKESYSDFIGIHARHIKNMPEAIQQLKDAGALVDHPLPIEDDFEMYMTLNRTKKNAAFFDALIAAKVMDQADLYNIFIYPTKEGITEKLLTFEKKDRDDGHYKGQKNIRLYRLHSPLKQAIYKQEVTIARLLLDAADDPAAMANRRYAYSTNGRFEDESEYANHTPLTFAIRSGNIEMVKLLLDTGAETALRNVYQNYKYSAMEYAVSIKDAAMIAFLLDYGVDPDPSNEWAPSPLFRAAQFGSPEITRLLLDAGARVKPLNEENRYVPLSSAVRRNNIEVARLLIEAGALPGQKFYDDYESYMPLVWAVKEKNVDMVQLLIDGGEDINLSVSAFEGIDRYSRHTPLTQAIDGDDMDMVHLLLDAGANINTPGDDFYGPLQTAIEKDNTALALELITMGADVNPAQGMPPLHLAASKGDTALTRSLLEAGADIFAESDYESSKGFSPAFRYTHTMLTRTALLDKDTFAQVVDLAREWGLSDINYLSQTCWAPLHAAAMYGNFDVGKMLIDRGANIHLTDKDGAAPLHYAIRYNRSEHEDGKLRLAQLLINAGANVNTADKKEGTPLYYALDDSRYDEDRKLPFLQILINAGADVNRSYAPYYYFHGYFLEGKFNHIMLNFDQGRIIEALIKAGANVNARDREGRSALMLHSFLGSSADVVKILINAGANVNMKNPQGETALMYALQRGYVNKAEALIAAGADVNARANNGDTPLMYGTFDLYDNNAIDIIRFLIKAGADLSIQNDQGETILMRLINIHDSYYYWNEQSAAIIRVLLEHTANDKKGLNLKDRNGWTALMYAAASPSLTGDILQSMIDVGADINAVSPEGYTALAVCNGHQKFNILKKAGAQGETLAASIPSHDRNRSKLLGMEGIEESDH